jgi:hypothetical protein
MVVTVLKKILRENNLFFKNVLFDSIPKSDNLVVFSCDDTYFKKYGIYNILSCNDTDQPVHVHLINPSADSVLTLKAIIGKLQIPLSWSTEYFETSNLNFYLLKSYYYMARFYLSNYIFQHTSVTCIKIVDADIIFNSSISFPESVNIGITYKKQKNTAWERTAAYFLFLTLVYKDFLPKVIELYEEKIKNIDFLKVEKIENKIQKANFTGLDQVCLTEILENECIYLNQDFLNLGSLQSFSSKGPDAKIWVLVGKTKKLLPDNYLPVKYKKYFEKIQ